MFCDAWLPLAQDTKVGIVTVLVALVSHKWVESIALSARCLKVGANWWCVPFATHARSCCLSSISKSLTCSSHPFDWPLTISRYVLGPL